jgi:hypothetical protein
MVAAKVVAVVVNIDRDPRRKYLEESAGQL